jgi:hypothetical protein
MRIGRISISNSNREIFATLLGIEIVILVGFIIVKCIILFILPMFETVARLQSVQAASSTIWWDLFVYEAVLHVGLLTFLFLKVRKATKVLN